MRVATSCDTIVRVCGLRARDTVETWTPARCAICLIPDGALLMPAKIRLWRATPQVTTHSFHTGPGCGGLGRVNGRFGLKVRGRRDGTVAIGARTEMAIELVNVQVLLP